MKIVREAAVRPIDTTTKITNWTSKLSMPIRPANAAASAPMPNHSRTKPDVKTSATINIAARTAHKTQNQSLIVESLPKELGLTLQDVFHHKPDIRRALG